jgi:hypothetical protein
MKEKEKNIGGDSIPQIGDNLLLSHSISQPLSDGLDHGLDLFFVEHGFILAERWWKSSFLCRHRFLRKPIDLIKEPPVFNHQHIFTLTRNVTGLNNLWNQVMIDPSSHRRNIIIRGIKVHNDKSILLDNLSRILQGKGEMLIDRDVASEHMIVLSDSWRESSFLFSSGG